MVKIPAAQARLFKNVFVCKRCKTKIRANPMKIVDRKVKCRRCNSKAFRPIKRGK
jgi:DNA-directed RNA polymerase subunit RPC12/RpoP